MKYAKLGNSELNVSRICMGCMGFGDAANGQHSWTIDEAHAREIIRRGLELGVNFFDTAIAYQSGTSEQYLGRALRDFARRDEVVVATKFLPRTPEEIAAGVSGQQHIARMIDKSLENLGMDHVDLYIYHMWDYQTPLRDIMEGLNDAVRAGKARYIGISNCFAWQLEKANALAEREGLGEVCLRAGALQPHLPRGGARNGPLLPRGKHRPHAVQRAGGRSPVEASRRDVEASGTGRLRPPEIRRRR